MKTSLKSVLTDDLYHCIITGSPAVERHHVFGGACKANSEKYGFIAPLKYDLHPNGVHADGSVAPAIDLYLKKRCQKYYEEHYGTRSEFIADFGRSYL